MFATCAIDRSCLPPPYVASPAVETTGEVAGVPWSLGDFGRLLRQADVLDLDAVRLPGSAVILPYGVRLLRHMRSIVEAALDRHGLAEYEYPALTATENIAVLEQLLPIREQVLRVGTDADFEAAAPRAALLPSGEAAIYSHWRRSIRRPTDLPLRMFRRAQYFRPAGRGHHSGRSLFRAMESGDIYEMHCAYASVAARQEGVRDLVALVSELCASFYLPVDWVLRPPWTNREGVAQATFAADLFLPIGKSLQIAAVYDQGTAWSKPFQVRFLGRDGWHQTEQVSGYVSRRLLYAHLAVGVRGERLALHPDIAPVQVAVVLQPGGSDDAAPEAIAHALRGAGVRVSTERCPEARSPASAVAEARQRGIPLVLLVRDLRPAVDRLEVVEWSGESTSEIGFRVDSLDSLVRRATERLTAAATGWERVALDGWARRRARATDRSQLSALIERRLQVGCPLAATRAAVLELERTIPGEVLGFASDPEPVPCVVTGSPVLTRAIVARRI